MSPKITMRTAEKSRSSSPLPLPNMPAPEVHSPPPVHAHTNFAIYRTPARHHQYMMALATAYSTRFNGRRLESATHAFWQLLSEDLINGISPLASHRLLVIPQYTVTATRRSPSKLYLADTSGVSKKLKRKAFTERKPDIIAVWIGLTRRDPKEAIPFVPVSLKDMMEVRNAPYSDEPKDEVAMRNWCTETLRGFEPTLTPQNDIHLLHTPNWHTTAVAAGGHRTFVHFELKRPASRHIPTAQRFFFELNELIAEAWDGAKKQASVIFRSEEKTKRLITIVASGEWWAFQITTRDGKQGKEMYRQKVMGGESYAFLDVRHSTGITRGGKPRNLGRGRLDDLFPQPSEAPDDSNDSDDDDKNDNNNDNDDDSSEEEKAEEEDGVPSGDDSDMEGGNHTRNIPVYRYLRHPLAESEEDVVLRLREAIPLSNKLSRLMCFGSPASNQRLYLIQELLRREAAIMEREYSESNLIPLPT